MILAIDIGNTNIVLGAIDQEQTLFTARISTDKSKTSDQYAVEIKDILKLYDFDFLKLHGAIISSVVPALCSVFKDAIKKITGLDSLVVEPGIKTGLNIKIDNPAQLGSDLVVSAVAAIAKYKTPMAVIDFGTATTITVIDNENTVMGGLIMPGIRISLDALTSRTSQLQDISLDSPKSIIGTNTVDSMKAGLVYGNAAMMDCIITRLEDKIGKKLNVIATGGLARFVIPHCVSKIIYDDNLMLDGLYILYKKNMSK